MDFLKNYERSWFSPSLISLVSHCGLFFGEEGFCELLRFPVQRCLKDVEEKKKKKKKKTNKKNNKQTHENLCDVQNL